MLRIGRGRVGSTRWMSCLAIVAASGVANAQAAGANAGAAPASGVAARRPTATGVSTATTPTGATTRAQTAGSTASPSPNTNPSAASSASASPAPMPATGVAPSTPGGGSTAPGGPVSAAASGNVIGPHAAAGETTDSGPHFTLDEAIGAMTRSHPLLVAARFNERSASYGVRAAALWTNPQISASWSDTVAPRANTAYDTRFGYASFGISQLIETSNLPRARRDAAEYERRGVVADSLGIYRGLVFDLDTAFFALVAALNRLQILNETAAQLAEAQRIVNARVTAGASPHYDSSRMSLALADVRAAVDDAEADSVGARGNLDVAVGPDAQSLHGTPQYDLISSPPLPPLAELIQQIVLQRADIVAARARVREAYAQVLIARRSVFQGITLFGGAAIGAGNGQTTMTQPPVSNGVPQIDVTFGVAFPLPFVDHGQGTIPAAEAHAEAYAATLHAIELAATQRVTSAYNEVLSRRDALQSYIDTGAAESFAMLREAQAAYREGRIQILDLVDAYTSIRDARLRLLQLALDARNAEINLWRAAGNVH